MLALYYTKTGPIYLYIPFVTEWMTGSVGCSDMGKILQHFIGFSHRQYSTLSTLPCRQFFLAYQFLKDRIIPVLIHCRQNLSHTAGLCEIHVGIFEISYMCHSTSWRSKLYRIKSVVYVCDVGLAMCNSDSKFQTPISPLFLNKNIKCRYAFS